MYKIAWRHLWTIPNCCYLESDSFWEIDLSAHFFPLLHAVEVSLEVRISETSEDDLSLVSSIDIVGNNDNQDGFIAEKNTILKTYIICYNATLWIGDLVSLILVKEARWLFLGSLLGIFRDSDFMGAAEAVVKTGSSLKSSNKNKSKSLTNTALLQNRSFNMLFLTIY